VLVEEMKSLENRKTEKSFREQKSLEIAIFSSEIKNSFERTESCEVNKARKPSVEVTHRLV